MNNKTIILNSTFISSEELWRSRRVLSALANPSDDTQPHAIIVKNKIKIVEAGCKESQFYSLPIGQAVASMYQPKSHIN